MNKGTQRITGIIFIICIYAILISSGGGLNVYAASPQWPLLDGEGSLGLNANSAKAAYFPEIISYNNDLYAAWYEHNGDAYQILVKKYDTTFKTWTFAGSGGGIGLNFSPYRSSCNPNLAVHNGALYIAWHELNIDGKAEQIRVKKYNPSSNTWNFIDGGSLIGINVDPMKNASNVKLISYDNDLYATWQESNGINEQIQIKKYNADSNNWTIMEGIGTTGLNKDPMKDALNPNPILYNGDLYIAWGESNGTASQIRVKKYNHTAKTWTFVDGGDTAGLNYNNKKSAMFPSLATDNSNLYIVWDESGDIGSKIRMKKYDLVTNTWTFCDGDSSIGLNYGSTNYASNPKIIAYNDALYVTWHEGNSAPEIRVIKYNPSTNDRTFVDGGLQGLNQDSSSYWPSIAVCNDDLFAIWSEGYTKQIKVAKYIIKCYSVSYEGNGNTGGTVSTDTNRYEPGDIVNVLDNSGGLVRNGYTFSGWSTSASGYGVYYPVGGSSFKMGTNHVNLYAKWNPNSYSVNFDSQGGSGTPMSMGVVFNSEYGALPSAGSKTGYQFKGWYTDAVGGTEITRSSKVTTYADHSLYAHWSNEWSFLDSQMATPYSQVAANVKFISYNNELYSTWIERVGQNYTYQLRVKKYDPTTKTWAYVDGGSKTGLNRDPLRNALTPDIVVYNGSLYITWSESNGAEQQVRVKKYDEANNIWNFVDGGGILGLNHNPSESAFDPSLMADSNGLYATWTELNDSSRQIRVKKYDQTNNVWIFIDGGGSTGLNKDPLEYAENPKLASNNNMLYATWQEAKQIRVKKYNSSKNIWEFIDGDSTIGLNYNTSNFASNPDILLDGDTVFVTWQESNSLYTGPYNIYLKKFNRESNCWEFINSGTSNQIQITKNSATDPKMLIYNNQLYLTWSESNDNTKQIRVRKYNPTRDIWTCIDGGTSIGLNYNSLNNAESPELLFYNNELYAIWNEAGGINVSKYNIDKIAPTLIAGDVVRINDSEVTVKFTSNKDGQFYYSVVPDGTTTEPTLETDGIGEGCTEGETIIKISTLTPGEKDIYIKVKDKWENISNVLKIHVPVPIQPTNPTGVIDYFIMDRNGEKIIVPLGGIDGYAFAYSTQNELYQYLKGSKSYPIVYGIQSGSKHMLMGGMGGYSMNYSLYATPLEAMQNTISIPAAVLGTYYLFEGFDVSGNPILRPWPN